MKKNILTEIKTEDLNKLNIRLATEKKELTNLCLDLKIKKLKNTRAVYHKRKDISRILTIINERRRQK